VREDVEATLATETRKCNLVIHGMLETDALQDVEYVVELMTDILYMNFIGMWIKCEELEDW
jgi:hypothetical protein